jgi:hypothetical protein
VRERAFVDQQQRHQFHQQRGRQPAHQRRRNRFITSAPAPSDQNIGTSPRNIAATVMKLGPDPPHRARQHRLAQIRRGPRSPLGHLLLPLEVEIDRAA